MLKILTMLLPLTFIGALVVVFALVAIIMNLKE